MASSLFLLHFLLLAGGRIKVKEDEKEEKKIISKSRKVFFCFFTRKKNLTRILKLVEGFQMKDCLTENLNKILKLLFRLSRETFPCLYGRWWRPTCNHPPLPRLLT